MASSANLACLQSKMGVGVTDLTIRLSDFGIAQRSLVVVLNEGLRLTRLLDARPRGLVLR